MKKKFFWLIGTAAAVTVLAAACGGDSTSSDTPTPAAPASGSTAASGATTAATAATAGGPTDLVALKQSPASLAADDAAWKAAKPTIVKTTVVPGSETKEPKDVTVQALYSDTDVWFRFEWADATEGTHNWVYDGTAWKESPDNEDLLALYWEITPNADFETRGCAALCHNSDTEPASKWYMISPKAGDTFDKWHWKSVRTNPVGQSDDKSLVAALADPTDVESASPADNKTGGGYSDNVNADKTGPAKMQDPAKKPSGGPNALLVSEAVTLDASKLKAGDKVPLELLAPFAGSRGDVEAKGAWAGSKWTVVLHRKLDTGHPDDAKFVVGKSYPFGLGVWNNVDGVNHTVSKGVYTLILK